MATYKIVIPYDERERQRMLEKNSTEFSGKIAVYDSNGPAGKVDQKEAVETAKGIS